MTIEELTKELSRYDPNTKVMIRYLVRHCDENGNYSWRDDGVYYIHNETGGEPLVIRMGDA